MKEIFKALIAEFHALTLPEMQRRELKLPTFPDGVRKAIALTGVRHSGKTWCLYQMMSDLLAQGLEKSRILYLNFEDERLPGMQPEHFQEIHLGYFEMHPKYLRDSNIYFFFDEIHKIKGWEKFICRLLDKEQMQLYLTGSSINLSSERIHVIEIFPYDLREYLKSCSVGIPEQVGYRQKVEMFHYTHQFLKWGGFPETVGTPPDVHRNLLQGYTASVIYRDIIDRHQVSNSHALRQLLAHCLQNSATIFSVNKIHANFKSMGYAIGKNTLYDFLDYFEDAYCFFCLEKYDQSLRKAALSRKKIYAVDQGLITTFSTSSQFDLCSQLENAVFSHLRRQSSDIFYYNTKDGKEVDFHIQNRDGTLELFQVSVSMKNPSTRKREVEGLQIAMKELGLSKGTIVTLDDDEVIEGIECIPAWKFFLGLNHGSI